MVQSGVDLAVGGVDRVGVQRRWLGFGSIDQAEEWSKQARPKLDQQEAELEAGGGQTIASALADTLDEAFGAQLAQVVPQLAEAVAVTDEAMASDDACVQLAGRPVADEAARMEQRLQQPDHSVVMQLE